MADTDNGGRKPAQRVALRGVIAELERLVKSAEKLTGQIRAELDEGSRAVLTREDASRLGHVQEDLTWLAAHLFGVQKLRDIRAQQGGHLGREG